MRLLQQYSSGNSIVAFEIIDNLTSLVRKRGHDCTAKRDKRISVARVGQIMCDEVGRQNISQIVRVRKGPQVMLEKFAVCQCGSLVDIVEVSCICFPGRRLDQRAQSRCAITFAAF